MSEPWWKAAVTAFLTFLASLLQSNKNATKTIEAQVKANEIENRVDAASDADINQLRTKWTRK